ncbi:hypothetical protein MNBD_GAMMA11-1643 [hydrothermal vent metagenome]|uniref:Uncharacterized protein n=1 Tax=hydrothermal vent metagenome TaxID=652676 RepID=A0A3B0YCE8_9ZZZZ
MEIALNGFNPQFDSSASVDTARLRQQQDARRQSERQSGQPESNRTRAQTNSGTSAQTAAENARVINGEVLSSETVRVNARESGSAEGSVLPRNDANQQSSLNGQAANRRISVDQAIQTFRDNELLVLAESSPRQVSGIINEFV